MNFTASDRRTFSWIGAVVTVTIMTFIGAFFLLLGGEPKAHARP